MPGTPISDVVLATTRHNRSRRHAAALAAVEDALGRGLDSGPLQIARADALIGLHRFREAFEVISALLRTDDVRVRPAALVRRAHVVRRSSRYLDTGLESARAARRAAERLGLAGAAVAAAARRESARIYARKHCPELAKRELAAAHRAFAADPLTRYSEGRVLMSLDERPAARSVFATLAAATEEGANHLGTLGLAHLAYVAGEFDDAHDFLDQLHLAEGGDIWPRRLRCLLLQSQGRWSDAVGAYDDLIEASPGAVSVWSDRYERAASLYRAGRIDAAVEGWRLIVAEAPDDDTSRMAARLVALLARPRATAAPRCRLPEFPSVTQLRDHCGPAACELYMRFFGLGSDQMAIARQIKRQHGGTPVYQMRRFLEDAGFATRRLEAELPRIKQLLDSGVPVILEEAYSSSNHVVVAIGYDDVRELLEVQDPISHRVRETPYEDLAGLQNLSNHGALVAVPRAETAMLEALDAIGAVDCEYIDLVDRAWAALERGDPEEGDRLVDRAIACERAYEFAWFYRFRRARDRAQDEPTADNRIAVHRVLAEITHIWPDDEWPQQFLGEALFFDGRIGDATLAFERARDRDPSDPYNWSMLAECHLRRGDLDGAYAALVEALSLDPANPRAHENLADLALRGGELDLAWALSDAARELAPANYFNHAVHGKLLEQDGRFADALAAYDRALELAPDREWVASRRALLTARAGDAEGAIALFRQLIVRQPQADAPRIELADMLYGLGRAEAAVAECDAVLVRGESAAARAVRGAALAQLGRDVEGLAELERALELRPRYPWAYAEIGELLAAAGRSREAVTAFAAAVGTSDGDPRYEYRFGKILVDAGHPIDGLSHLQAAAEAGPMDEADLIAIGELMLSEGVGEPEALFARIAQRRPEDLRVLRAHVHLLVDVLFAPARAQPLIERIAALDANDPYALVARGRDRMGRSLALEQQGELDLREAIARAPGLVFARRTLARALSVLGRYDEALEVLEPMPAAYATELIRVDLYLGKGELKRAEEIADAYERDIGGSGAMVLRYRICRRRGDWRTALVCAETLSREFNERDDDGRLDAWEVERFDCLLRVGEIDRAARFGRAQAVDAASAARLASAALTADQMSLASGFAEFALRLAPNQVEALAVRGRCAELADDLATAFDSWRHIGRLSPNSHSWREHIGRVCLGTGDLGTGREMVEEAAAGGHLCAWAQGLHAQLRLIDGDRAGAAADLERAWAVASAEQRSDRGQDIWALRAALAGDRLSAQQLFDAYLARRVSRMDRARVARVREALRI